MKTLLEYAKENPGCKLSEYISYMEACNEQSRQTVMSTEERIADFYSNLIGKYFMIKFNNYSRGYVYIDCDVRILANRFKVYRMYRGNNTGTNGFNFNLEKNTYVNHLWFKCPDVVASQDLAVEISKSEFEAIVSHYDNIDNLIKNTLNQ